MPLITSRENPLVKQLRVLSRESTAYRQGGQVWLEGEHLCQAARQRGLRPLRVVLSQSLFESGQGQAWLDDQAPTVVLSDKLFADLSDLPSPARLGWVLAVPAAAAPDPQAPTVVLDRLQDAGNVGSVLRCASAFGFKQVLALKGTAALWSPKVLRAGMGAHFGLRLMESLQPQDLQALRVPLLVTSVHEGPMLHELQSARQLPWPCAWVLGHEGQGVSAELMARASQPVRIAQPGGEESLNVAAAAAICLHASAAAALADQSPAGGVGRGERGL